MHYFLASMFVVVGLFLVACTISEPTPRRTHASNPTSLPKPLNTMACDRAYPTVCIDPYPPDVDCGEIAYRRFQVLRPDPHGFDRDRDGVGCEWD